VKASSGTLLVASLPASQIEVGGEGARWKISHRTLERWRWAQEGPRYLKIGGRVVYRVSDVEAFEREVQGFPDELPAET